MKRIESRDNAMFKAMKSCLTAKGIREEKLVLVSGTKNVAEFLERRRGACRALIAAPKHDAPAPSGMEHIQLHGDLFHEIDVLGTHAPMLWVNAPEIPAWDPASGFAAPGLHLLIPFQDPENTGAVIRDAVAFNVSSVILLQEAAYPFLPKTVRASAGTVFDAPLALGPSVRELPTGLPLVALSTEGRPLHAERFPKTFGLLPGLEGPGLPDSLRGNAVAIPMPNPQVDSLNAAAATAIALYVWSRGAAGG